VNGDRAYRWLAAIPILGICVGSPIVDRMHATVAGAPALLVWIVGCVLLTSVVMAVISALDERPPS
jgi:uncharacterized protein DUF3311